MGAVDFITSEKGSSARAAFALAQEDARYESGHGGYTGTIAEVNDFRMIDVEKEAEWALKKLAEKREYLTVKVQKQLGRELKEARAKGDWETANRALDHCISCQSDEMIVAACKRLRDNNRLQMKALKGKKTRPQAVIGAMFDFDHPEMNKSICGCIETKKGVYTFFGWASC